jgi:hypothetical protein
MIRYYYFCYKSLLSFYYTSTASNTHLSTSQIPYYKLNIHNDWHDFKKDLLS